jgi:hypothetical protein
MKLQLFVRFLALFSGLFPVSQIAFGGSESHGGDLARDQDNPWFLGDAPVEYCIVVAQGFRTPNGEDLTQVVAQSIDKWRAFFTARGIDRGVFRKVKINGSEETVGLALNFVLKQRCDTPSKQLRILFGVTDDPLISQATSLGNALAASVRGDYDHSSYRTGGVIWVRNAGSNVHHALEHLVLHEFGHIFGMRHDSVFVMDTNVADQVKTAQSQPHEGKYFGNIEAPYWPWFFSVDVPVHLGTRPMAASDLGGRECVGVVSWRIPAAIRHVLGLDITPGVALGLSENDRICVKIDLELKSIIDFFDRTNSVWVYFEIYELRLEPAGQAPTILQIKVKPRGISYGGNPLPSLYTTYPHPQVPAGVTVADGLTGIPRHGASASMGVIEIGGKKYGATIENVLGVRLEIFISETAEWWGIK